MAEPRHAPQLVLLSGLQASGKTSFFHQQYGGSHRLVSKDRMPNNRRREARQRELITEELGAGHSVVVDNTNPTPADRTPLIAIGRSLGAWIVGFWLRTDLNTALERNAARAGRARVPVVALYATAKRFQPPTWDEGYDQLFTVSATLRGFEVSPHPAQPVGRHPQR